MPEQNTQANRSFSTDPLLKIRGAIIRLKNNLQAAGVLISTMQDPILRPLIPEINKQRRNIPTRYETLALPEFLTELTPCQVDIVSEKRDDLRNLLDAIAQLDWWSPFGICLRRSLLRYHFLRRTGQPLGIIFGVRLRGSNEPAGLAGHAWNTLNGQPYHEREENFRGFTAIYEWLDVDG